MNRAEFMAGLSVLLSDITEEEREEALSYYEDYFCNGQQRKTA